MDIRERIIAFRNSRDRRSAITYLVDHPEELEALIKIITNLEEYPLKEYGSWFLLHVIKANRTKMQPYYPVLVDILFTTNDQTVLRNITCCLSELEITDYRESELIDLLISFVQDTKNTVALHVYSIYVLIQFCQKYSELTQEIMEIIELNQEEKSAAFRVAKRNFLQKTQLE